MARAAAESPQSGPTATDQSETGPDTVTTTQPEPKPSTAAATSGGPKLIRTLHPGDRFVFDRKAHEDDQLLQPQHRTGAGVVDGTYREFTPDQATAVLAAASAARVRVLVADKEG